MNSMNTAFELCAQLSSALNVGCRPRCRGLLDPSPRRSCEVAGHSSDVANVSPGRHTSSAQQIRCATPRRATQSTPCQVVGKARVYESRLHDRVRGILSLEFNEQQIRSLPYRISFAPFSHCHCPASCLCLAFCRSCQSSLPKWSTNMADGLDITGVSGQTIVKQPGSVQGYFLLDR